MPDHITRLSDAQLADRFAQVDAKIRGMKQHSPLADKLEELLWEIRTELARRKEAAYGERCTD
jgi:hypothetical protein